MKETLTVAQAFFFFFFLRHSFAILFMDIFLHIQHLIMFPPAILPIVAI